MHLIWNYKKVKADRIEKSLNSVDWDFVLYGKNAHQRAEYLNEILMNVFSNYIPSTWTTIYGTKYSKIDQVKFFKGCLPQISLGPFLNALPQMTENLHG